MAGDETELFERAQSIVRKALSAISEDKEAEGQEEEAESGDDRVDIGLEDIKLENENNPEATLQEKAIKEAAVTLTEQVLSKATEEREDDFNTSTSSPGPDNLVPGDNLFRDQETGEYIFLLSRGSTRSLRIPSADLYDDQEEEKEEEEEEREETRAEFVIRKTFENFTEYAKLFHDKDRLSEKRYLQLLRELGLVGPGAKINTTEAEMVYFNHAAQRTVGLTMGEFKECLEEMVRRNECEMESITEDVLYPALPVHHYRTVFMSVK